MSGSMRFCPECSNILFPREDKKKKALEYACKQCQYAEMAGGQDDEMCVFRHDVTYVAKEAIRVNPAVTKDPTLGRDFNFNCFNCDGNEAVFYQLPEKQSPDSMTLIFVCCKCHEWREEGKPR